MIAFSYAARTDLGLGSKSRNEDSAYASPDLLILCDGMGGHAAGDVASSTVVGELVHRLDGEADGVDEAADQLEAAILDANALLADEMAVTPDMDGMGTTCIALMRVGNKIVQANVGDSRAFLLRDGKLTQITKDHSFVQSLLDEGRISEEEALHHPQRSLVTRVLTGRPEDKPDLSVREAKVGDRYLICSDGLSDYVAQDTIEEIIRMEATPGQIADKLIQIALRASTRDNVTVVVAEIITDGPGAPTVPQAVGAAANRGTTPAGQGAGNTPAEKAAALTRQAVTPDPLDPDVHDVPPVLAEEGGSGRSRRFRGAVLGLLTLLLLSAAAAGAYIWSQSQYFIGEQGGKVAIYRGLPDDLGPIRLSSPQEQTDILLSDLPEYQQERVRHRTLPSGSRADVERTVATLRQESDPGVEPTSETTSTETESATETTTEPSATDLPPGSTSTSTEPPSPTSLSGPEAARSAEAAESSRAEEARRRAEEAKRRSATATTTTPRAAL